MENKNWAEITRKAMLEFNEDLALDYARQGAEEGNAECMYLLYNLLINSPMGKTTEEEDAILDNAGMWLQRAAEAGYPQAICEHAEQLMDSDNMEDVRKGYEFLEQCATNGYPQAKIQLADYLLNDEITIQDPLRAAELYSSCINDTEQTVRRSAMDGLANMYLTGYDGFPVNPVKAAELYREAFYDGEPSFLMVLTDLREEFPEVMDEQTFNEMVDYGADKLQDKVCMTLKASSLENEGRRSEALDYAEKAYESGDSFAGIQLASLCMRGKPTQGNLNLAERIFRELAPKNTESYLNLGNLYLDRRWDKFNPQQAMTFFTKAAKLGMYKGYLQLGMMYLTGNGVKQNLQTANNFFVQGASKKNHDCFLAGVWMIYHNLVKGVTWEDTLESLRATDDFISEVHLAWDVATILFLHKTPKTAMNYLQDKIKKMSDPKAVYRLTVLFGSMLEKTEPGQAASFYTERMEKDSLLEPIYWDYILRDRYSKDDKKREAFQRLEELSIFKKEWIEYYLGMALLNGNGCTKDGLAGMERLRKASDMGLPEAAYQLSCFVEDDEESLDYLAKVLKEFYINPDWDEVLLTELDNLQ